MKTTIILLILTFIVGVLSAKDIMRKSIVFDKNTPDVFYCPIHKPTGFDKLIVKYAIKIIDEEIISILTLSFIGHGL